jgi:tRNA (cmo5U34)-methyltransferase
MKPFDNTTPHLSKEYDIQVLNTIPYYDCFHREIINMVQTLNSHPAIWLDTGAGTGTMITQCIDSFPDALFLLADPSEEMLLVAQNKLSEYDARRVQYLPPVTTQNITLSLSLRPDVITAVQSHHYLNREERVAATEVCYELLPEGGIFITFENIRPFTEQGIISGKRNWSNYQISRGKSEEQVRKHIERFDSEYFPITVEDHLQLYRECGFRVVELFWYSYMQAGFYCLK